MQFLSVEAYSFGVTVVQPLTAGTVFDGDNPGVEQLTQYATNMLFDQLGRLPGRGGAITDYPFSIGTKPERPTSPARSIPAMASPTTDTAVQLHLTVGTTYYATVTAYDSELNESMSATSPGIKILAALDGRHGLRRRQPWGRGIDAIRDQHAVHQLGRLPGRGGAITDYQFSIGTKPERPTSPARSMPAMASPTTIPGPTPPDRGDRTYMSP